MFVKRVASLARITTNETELVPRILINDARDHRFATAKGKITGSKWRNIPYIPIFPAILINFPYYFAFVFFRYGYTTRL